MKHVLTTKLICDKDQASNSEDQINEQWNACFVQMLCAFKHGHIFKIYYKLLSIFKFDAFHFWITVLSKNEKHRLLRWPGYLWGCIPFQFLNQLTKYHETSYRHYTPGGQPTPYLLYSLQLKCHINLWGGSNTSAKQRFSLAFSLILINNRLGMEIQT